MASALRRPGRVALARAALLLPLVWAELAAPAAAHRIAPLPLREVVWLEGRTLAEGAPGRGGRVVTLALLGEERRFEVLDWRVLSPLAAAPAGLGPPGRMDLEGDRRALARLLASSGARLTILAERRPGAAALCLVAMDACTCGALEQSAGPPGEASGEAPRE